MLEEAESVQTLIAKRTCGECQVCCMALPVPELAKPPRRMCAHQCPQGCAIYSQRPKSCSEFECLWKLSDVMGDNLRPDVCGVLFDAYHPEKVVVALSRGTEWKTGEAYPLISRMLNDGYVIWVRNLTATHLLLPAGVPEPEGVARLAKVKDRLYGSPELH